MILKYINIGTVCPVARESVLWHNIERLADYRLSTDRNYLTTYPKSIISVSSEPYLVGSNAFCSRGTTR